MPTNNPLGYFPPEMQMALLDRLIPGMGVMAMAPMFAPEINDAYAALGQMQQSAPARQEPQGASRANLIDWEKMTNEQLYKASSMGSVDGVNLPMGAFTEANRRGIRLRDYAPKKPAP